ncbi:E3 SUMO-protein ligase ZBED1-like [Eriocheir sinensis]|uniref:E3 SUMO-protein ligase ZBED1-like n=1 Tax=Eriocheir sinensis TaxID=95602 RepID=UPI0021CA8894|nr:E3 SUMO-protein ligase ZBED1-like [Eriocheir sinensis]XP_050725203.1 E3 SUMO-protein ligase ZBED1-like [Eriocheir sinensis]XP_050725204.1 E3 SUMO-protein ligase ZBED1-like [Eriocheir sinensis]XP_050725205.1 E3 SUMO-protein ligase ZBED1-like [Eriocheir sinensis]
MASKRARRSPVWTFMKKTDPRTVVCLLCKDTLKFCSSTSSLMKHISSKHPAEYAQLREEKGHRPEPARKLNRKETTPQPTPVPDMTKKKTSKADPCKKRELDQKLALMIIQDMQPFSVVDDEGFKCLVKALDPCYELPSKRELSRSYFPNIYRQEVERIKKELEDTQAISLATETWTSANTKHFITITAHFISPEWKLKSVVLETLMMQEAHTAADIAKELTTICNNWNILNKVCSVVTDNVANVTLAVSNIMKLCHLQCFAHTLNLVVKDSVKNTEEVNCLLEKIQLIVSYFHHSVEASNKLSELQEDNNLPVKKLIQSVEARWNSSYYMMQQFVEQNHLIAMALCLMGRNDLCLNTEELELVINTLTVLEPFEEATKEMVAEEFTPLSKVLPIVKGLQDYMHSSADKNDHKLYTTFPLGVELLQQMTRRFHNLEGSIFMGAASLLDPRFKNVPFADPTNVEQIEKHLVSQMQGTDSAKTEVQAPSMSVKIEFPGSCQTVTIQTKKSSIWAKFDAKIEEIAHISSTDPSTGPSIEMRRYMEEAPIPREEDPLEWWKKHGVLFPKLQEQAKMFLCSPASSVPAERLFSEAGELVSQRRSCLKDKHVNMITFLNKNMM